MASDMKTRPAADYTCTCGAIHTVTMVTTEAPATDSAECEWCGTVIRKWQDAKTWPIFEMKTPPG
jgi:hypothetical protein